MSFSRLKWQYHKANYYIYYISYYNIQKQLNIHTVRVSEVVLRGAPHPLNNKVSFPEVVPFPSILEADVFKRWATNFKPTFTRGGPPFTSSQTVIMRGWSLFCIIVGWWYQEVGTPLTLEADPGLTYISNVKWFSSNLNLSNILVTKRLYVLCNFPPLILLRSGFSKSFVVVTLSSKYRRWIRFW